MTECKWTPGPWVVINNSRHDTYHIGPIDMWDNEKDSAAEVPYSHPIRSVESANARLIAAAPDMYEALSDAVDAWDTHNKSGDWVQLARAALAKAEGRET